MRKSVSSAACAALLVAVGCGSDDSVPTSDTPAARAASGLSQTLDDVVKITGDRGLYVRCTGTGSPTVVMERGDGDTSDSYAFAEAAVAKATRTCVYDRANLGRSGAAAGPRQLGDLVGDLERLLRVAEIPGRMSSWGPPEAATSPWATPPSIHARSPASCSSIPALPSRTRRGDRRGDGPGQSGERREARLPAGRAGRLGRSQADR